MIMILQTADCYYAIVYYYVLCIMYDVEVFTYQPMARARTEVRASAIGW